MYARDLKKLLEDVPDNIPILCHSPDHMMGFADVKLSQAAVDRDDTYWEYFGDEYLEDGQAAVPALIIE